jgi:hydrogenase maturation protease
MAWQLLIKIKRMLTAIPNRLAGSLGRRNDQRGPQVAWQMGKERILIGAQPRPPLILVMGLGNVLFRDDGVGVHLVRLLRKDPIPKIACAEVGTAVLGSLSLLDWADKILAVDAMQAGGKPGTLYSFEVGSGDHAGFQESMHEKILLSAFKFVSRKTPPAIQILGIEPETIAFGLDLSPAVQDSLPRGIGEIRRIVQGWIRPADLEMAWPRWLMPGK